MNVLIIGSGGREHALARAVSDSPLCDELYIAPGNPGIARHGHCISLDSSDHDAVCRYCHETQIELVIIGPEAPLVDGLADSLNAAGIAVFGPSAAAAQLEGSKAFARDFCQRHEIPQPQWQSFDDAEQALSFAKHLGGACVVKADGLAAGKGVIVCDDEAQAEDAIRSLLGGRFKDASASIVVEERLIGVEMSAFALLDGKTAIWMASAQDHKRAYDGDKGENTGGMGAVSPSPLETDALRDQIMETVIIPVSDGMAAEGMPYQGVLYAGLMLTDDGPKVIEFNCRFGDPEAQVILPRMMSDVLTAIITQTEQGLEHYQLRLADEHAVTVVMATKGYPGAYETGSIITQTEQAETEAGCFVYHAGTSRNEAGELIASGGRVLAITAIASDSQNARKAAYDGVKMIGWQDGFFRTDIAKFS